MTRLTTKYLAITDRCIRCPTNQPLVAPDGTGSTTDAGSVVLTYRCTLGHCWQRRWARSDLKRGPAKATTAPRRHLATTATTTPNADHTDVAHLSKAVRQPSPWTGWNPTRRAWEAR